MSPVESKLTKIERTQLHTMNQNESNEPKFSNNKNGSKSPKMNGIIK